MNRDQMLAALGLSGEQLRDLLNKFCTFLASLEERQQAVVRRSLPTITEALAAFGPEVTEADLLKLFKADAHPECVILCLPALHRKNRPESIP